MKRIIILFVFATLFSSAALAQQINPETFNSSASSFMFNNFGNDVLISDISIPLSPVSGIKVPNGTMYLAVNDTLRTPQVGLLLYRSTNDGNTWTLYNRILIMRLTLPRIKAIMPAPDSLLVYFQMKDSVWRWNYVSWAPAGLDIFDSTVIDFDVVSTSTGSTYMFWTSPNTKQLKYKCSTDGGFTWEGGGIVSNTAGRPMVTLSGTGDTMLVNYRFGTNLPAENNEIRSLRYIETAPGTLTAAGSPITLVPAGNPHREYKSVFIGTTAWFLYTENLSSHTGLYYRISTNGGADFGSPMQLGDQAGFHEYRFDAAARMGGAAFTGIDIVYYADSNQSGPPTNNTDKVMHTSASILAPGTFSLPVQISQHAPSAVSGGDYPSIIQINGTDFGTAWVGLDGTNKKIYYDRLSLITSVNSSSEMPASYSLKQNYPNPFNPSTKIAFTIPQSGFTSLKIYNVLGVEVARVMTKDLHAGSYEVDFNAANLSSGVYFYKLSVNGFSEVKKMIVQK